MTVIEKATIDDFTQVLPCLKGFDDVGQSNTDEEWKRIFTCFWETEEDYCGYKLVVNGEVKGFVGLIFSTRKIGGKAEPFCNITTWIVDKEYRSKSIALLFSVLKLKGYTLTCFTAHPELAAPVFRKLGFNEVEVKQQFFAPIPRISLLRSVYSFSVEREVITSRLDPIDATIYNDHKTFNCGHLLVYSATEYAYMVFTLVKKKGLSFAEVHYVSNPSLFRSFLEASSLKLCLALRVFGIIISNHLFHNLKSNKAFDYIPNRSFFFKPSSEHITASNIDVMYSEVATLFWH